MAETFARFYRKVRELKNVVDKGEYSMLLNPACGVVNAFDELKNFDIEVYIRGLEYGEATDDYARTLVAGNLRRLYRELVPGADNG
jgi:hypothetical protein